MNYLIIAGLGNPGEKYKNTRHNIGFIVIDEFRGKNNFPEFKLAKKYNSLIAENDFADKKIILAKPQTFMNESGQAIKNIVSSFPAAPRAQDKFSRRTPRAGQQVFPLSPALAGLRGTSLIIVHDDIDLPLGKIKISISRGSAGHKGVESIIKRLKTEDFIRVRVGILPGQEKPKNPEKFVLQIFSKEEKEILKKTIEKSVAALETIVKDSPAKAMNKYN